ncbi:FAD-linked oxidase C-terminal domain-containing protein [Desulfurella sp.]|uniref:FAD-binding oxidoreductase n=1 Tax=Desulfurella sp. TaxID=1962857 RepID=UPI0025C09211|nr:FAD-linked oxidase C-terminal domain-containing protein [Desulfurella sp.]
MIKYNKVTTELANKFKHICGEKNVIYDNKEELFNYAYDESGKLFAHMPEIVVKPQNTEQVSKIMKLANENIIPVTPRAAGSGVAGAAIPLKGGIVLSVEKMNKILEINTIDRVAVVEPAVVTNELCERVLEEGLLYAGYPMSVEMSFIGGNVATNAGGDKVIKYGNTRKHVLGLEVVLANGSILNLGGRIRKQTWGYDLLDLMIGSEGTLGIFTKIILNLLPAPGKSATLLVPFDNVEKTTQAVSNIIIAIRKLPLKVEFMDKLSVELSAKYLNTTIPFQDKAKAYLIIEVDGNSQQELEDTYQKAGEACLKNGALDVFIGDDRKSAENIWRVRMVFAEALRLVDPYVSLSGDVVVPPSKVTELMEKTIKIANKYKIQVAIAAHIADGNLHPELFKPDYVSLEKWPDLAEKIYSEITEEAIKLGGVGSGEHGVGFLKKDIFLNTKSEIELNIMREIKKVFDPNNILNPGKII